MITKEAVQERIRQLQAERAGVEEKIQRLTADIEHGRRLLHAYDGALGELLTLIQGDDSEVEPE